MQVCGYAHTGGTTAQLCEYYDIPWKVIAYPTSRRNRERAHWLARFAWQLRREQPDILLPYTTVPNVACSLLWRWSGARLCIWNQRDAGFARFLRLQRWAAAQAPCFVSNSQHGSRFVSQQLRVADQRIHVIPNGVQLSPARADRATWRQRLGARADELLVCMLANLTAAKDHATLLKAWRIVLERMTPTICSLRLVLAGRFDVRYEALIRQAHALGLERSLCFLGPVDDVSGLLGAVDLGVYSSTDEGCPNGVLECMSAGLAVAGTDIPGIREALGTPGYPFLAPRGDANALADRLSELACDPQLRSHVGKQHRERIRREFNVEQMAERMTELIMADL